MNDVLISMVETYGEPLAAELYDSNGRLFPYVRLMVNGRDIAFLDHKMETELQDGDEILILPLWAAGDMMDGSVLTGSTKRDL